MFSLTPQFRIGTFILFLAILMVAEKFFPRRPFQFPRLGRDGSNLSLAALNNFLLLLSRPLAAVEAARWAEANQWGLFHFINLPPWLAITIGLLLLDLMIYSQHILFHRIPLLWRFHRVHHADVELDVTSGIRFHPIEIFISLGIKMIAIIILGASLKTVVIFELVLLLSSMFNHANLNIPETADRFLRRFIVTPDFHRVHHSVFVEETNSNYGFNFSWWDRIFRTYRAQPKAGHIKMSIGLKIFRASSWFYLHKILIEPFINGETARVE